MQELERVEHPKPNAEFLYRTFDAFRAKHPWIASDNVRPKSVARDMFERFAGFNEYVKLYGLGPSEGVLLRYLTQAYKTLVQNVPDTYKTEAVEDIAAFLRATLARVDSSLVTEWERMVAGESSPVLVPGDEPAPLDPSADPRAFRSRLRAEMHALVKALATADYDEAVNATGSQGDNAWSADQFAEAMAPVLAEHGEIVFDHRARWSHLTRIAQSQPRLWIVQQTLVGKEGETSWMVEAEVDLRPPFTDDRPLLQVIGISA
jgi:hypothetical protein